MLSILRMYFSENLSEFLLILSFSSLAFWFLRGQKSGLLILSATAIACSGLTRPTYQTLALVVSGFLLLFRVIFGAKIISNYNWMKATGILLAVSIIFLGGYSFMNYTRFHFFGVYPMTGFNLTNMTTRFLEQLPDEYTAEREALIRARDAQLIARGGDHTGHDSFWRAIPDLVKLTGLAPIPDLSQYLMHLNLIIIRKAPLHYLQEVFASFSSYWLPTATELANSNSSVMQTFWVLFHFLLVALFALQLVVVSGIVIFQVSQRFFSGGSYRGLPPTHLFPYLLASTIVFYNAMASAAAGTPDPRYRVPTEPLIIFMCFLGFYLWRRLIRDMVFDVRILSTEKP